MACFAHHLVHKLTHGDWLHWQDSTWPTHQSSCGGCHLLSREHHTRYGRTWEARHFHLEMGLLQSASYSSLHDKYNFFMLPCKTCSSRRREITIHIYNTHHISDLFTLPSMVDLGHEGSIMIGNNDGGALETLGLMCQHVATAVVNIICNNNPLGNGCSQLILRTMKELNQLRCLASWGCTHV